MKPYFTLGALMVAFTAGAFNLTVAPKNFNADDPVKVIKRAPSEGRKRLTPVSDQILTTVPEGTVMKEVTWSSKTCYPLNGKVTWAEVSGFVPTIVTDGNDMYINSPLTALAELAQAWIKGTVSEDGTKVVFHTPQAYMVNEATPGVPMMLYATRVSSSTGKPVEGETDLVFSYVDGDLVQTDGGLLALTDIQGNFYGYGDMDIQVRKINETPVTLPEDAEDSMYVMEYSRDGQKNRISAILAFSGNDVYFSDPVGVPNAWFKGTQDSAEKIVVSTPQYMGSGSGYPLFLVTGTTSTHTEVDPMGQPYEVVDYNVVPEKDIVFTFNSETGECYTDQLLIFTNAKDKAGDAVAAFNAPKYTQYEARPLTPAAPSITYYVDLKDYEAWGLRGCMMTFEIPSESTDGEFIPQENIYYQIAFDGQPLVFFEANLFPYYAQFQDPQTATAMTVNGDTHQLQTELKPQKSITVQSFYEFGGEYLPSEKISVEIENGQIKGDNVNEVGGDNEIVSFGWYDLSGRRVNADTEGIIIRREILRDGSVRCVKTVNI